VTWEDSSYWDNPGVNFKGLGAAAWENLSPIGTSPGFLEGRGGSSITQQLVKNVYFTQAEREERSPERKLKETIYALEITRDFSKKQILEWYLNLISYGNNLTGVQAAARGYFNVNASELNYAQAATLAVIPQNPTIFNPLNNPELVLQQRNLALLRMYEEKKITGEWFFNAANQPLAVSTPRTPVIAPHFVFNVVEPQLIDLFGPEAYKRDGLVVTTSIDLELQNQAQAILEDNIQTYESSGGHNGAVVAIDPKTAELVVYVGSRNYFDDTILGRNDMAFARNSPGSSFKPFVYLTGFVNKGWGAGTKILDTPLDPVYWDGVNELTNPIRGYQGPITIRNALGNSLNVPAVKAALYVGKEEVVRQAAQLGITTARPAEELGPSVAVGGVDLRLVEMVQGYTVFPNMGALKGVDLSSDEALDPVVILRVEDRDGNVLYPLTPDGQPAPDRRPIVEEDRIASPAQAAMMNSILSDPKAQCITFGVCGALSIPGRPLAVKTGTSEPYEECRSCIGDTWAFGYTPQMVVGTWFGNADNTAMTNISSTNVSWHTVRDFMTEFHADLPVEPFTPPEGLVKGTVCMPSSLPADNECPSSAKSEDFFPKAFLDGKKDDWWKLARIDTRTNKLASNVTPPAFASTRFFLQLPANLSEFEREQALEWLSRVGGSLGQAPTEVTSESDIPSYITAPTNGARVNGGVAITGRAASSEFQEYRLEFRGIAGWRPITRSTTPVPDGVLGLWQTTGLTPGPYTLRLVVIDRSLGEIIASIQVIVEPPPPPPGIPPIGPTPAAPQEGIPPPGPGNGNGNANGRRGRD
jgi:membrane peptidoglycan carboxypeptidase